MKNFLCIVIFCLMFIITYAYAQDSIVNEIKDIDSKMSAGTIKYTATNDTESAKLSGELSKFKMEHITKSESEIIYYSNDNYKVISSYFGVNGKISDHTNYYDSKYVVDVSAYDAMIRNRRDVSPRNISVGIGAEPSLRYGRGLSRFDELKYNNETNEVFAYDNSEEKFKIIAKVDPDYQYIATSIKFYFDNEFVFEIENNNPILIDNKYYICSKSILRTGPAGEYNILSATFKKPNEKDCIFNLKNNKLDVIDTRVMGSAPVRHKADDVKDLTLEDILEQTKRKSLDFDKAKLNNNKELNNPESDKKKD